eukprot:11891733-Ditylum_brightwellii.AAC.1
MNLLSNAYLESDLVAIQIPSPNNNNNNDDDDDAPPPKPRLCVVRADATVAPLCRHEDDVETDLFLDPRPNSIPSPEDISDENVVGTYGEGWYGQRPVPSLGGGPGYGAEADEIWS